ncbi:response regulator [Paenibacillus sacheonensis]|uniref:Response regulator n=1 Tax=Paenibacillus sacheonensis TaxID=742054 RepID=A0A7X4YVI8_9BACL|nr:response regulator [Paenibacillus sacheonensis]MBM7569475.1 two-component system response regulator YesN [Paenibacillus sacheonensis]NBC73357.1 response regulator [Paenibacillus sacheonensis]
MEINVLLVDDEAVDLEWLRRRVAGSGHLPLHSVRTAASGFAALKMMEQHRIDIILSDIRMPIMSGMEFARKAKEMNPEVHILFISGLQDFHYAQEAIQLNASGYLLKPVNNGELNRMLTELCDKIEQERKQHISLSETLTLVNQELLLRWFNEAAPGHAEKHIQGFLAPYLQSGSAVAVIEIDDMAWKIQSWTQEEQRIWTARASQFIRTFAHDRHAGMVITTYDYRFVVLAAVQEPYFAPLLEELIGAFNQAFSFSLTIGSGMYATELDKLHDSYRQAQAALSIKWIVGKNRLIQDASEWHPQEKIASDVEEVVDRMLKAMLDYDLTTIDDCLLQLFAGQGLVSRKNDIYEIIIRMTSKLHADLRQMNEHLYDILNWDSHQPFVLFQFETMHDILSWLRRRFFELSELLYLKRQRQKRKLIDAITEYVKERLEHKITLNEIAAHFDFTPNYLGQLFKAETNSLFSDFLNELRMKRVCELLGDPTKKVYEIAEQAGYKNIIYFNRQFKQHMGMSPGEYRKRNKI